MSAGEASSRSRHHLLLLLLLLRQRTRKASKPVAGRIAPATLRASRAREVAVACSAQVRLLPPSRIPKRRSTASHRLSRHCRIPWDKVRQVSWFLAQMGHQSTRRSDTTAALRVRNSYDPNHEAHGLARGLHRNTAGGNRRLLNAQLNTRNIHCLATTTLVPHALIPQAQTGVGRTI